VNQLATWISSNPYLEALAIIVAVSTAAFYVFKFVRWLYALAGSAIARGIAETYRAGKARRQLYIAAASQDSSLFIAEIGIQVFRIAWMIFLTLFFGTLNGVGDGAILGKPYSLLAGGAMGVLIGTSLGRLSSFLKSVRAARVEDLQQRFETFRGRKF
jgi:hypothetical protein